MRYLPPIFLILFLFIFFTIPIIAGFEDPRTWTKFFSALFFFISIFTFQNKFLTEKAETSKTFINELSFLFGQIIIICFSYLYLLNQHYNSFFLVDFDFIALAEILNNSLQGDFFITNHYGKEVNGNYLTHHFSPSILILSPFLFLSQYRLGYGYGLLFFVLFSYFLFAILLLKKNIRGNSFYLIMTLFNVNIILHRLFYSYHFELLIVFFFLLFFIGKELNKSYLTIPAFILLLLLKEDVAIYLCFLGIYFIFKKNLRYAIPVISISILYFVFVPEVFRSFLNKSAEVNWLLDWSKWGNSYSEIIFNILTNPFRVMESFFSKIKVLKEFIFSFSPIVLLSPKLMLVSLPIFVIHFISDRLWYNTLYNYYSYSVIPFFILATVYSIQKINESRFSKHRISILSFCIALSLYASSGDEFFPYKKIKTDPARVQDVKELTEVIPASKTVATQFDLGGFISRANPLYPLHEKNLDKDYILVDTKRGFSPYIDKGRIDNMILKIKKEKTHLNISEKNGILLFEKNK